MFRAVLQSRPLKRKIILYPLKLDILARRLIICEKPHRDVVLLNFLAEISKGLEMEIVKFFPLIFHSVLMPLEKKMIIVNAYLFRFL